MQYRWDWTQISYFTNYKITPKPNNNNNNKLNRNRDIYIYTFGWCRGGVGRRQSTRCWYLATGRNCDRWRAVEFTEILHIDCTPHGRKGLYRYCVAACTPSGRSLRDRLRPASGESTPSSHLGDPASSGTPFSSVLEPLSSRIGGIFRICFGCVV